METEEFKVYPWRFLVLISFSSFTFCQSWIWLGFGSFSTQTALFFGWTSAQKDAWISWYLFLGPALFLFGTPLFLWLIDKKGLRTTCIVGSVMNLVGVALKLPCLWIPNRDVGWALVFFGQALTSISGVAAMAVPAKLSSVWFAPHERRLVERFGWVGLIWFSFACFLFALCLFCFSSVSLVFSVSTSVAVVANATGTAVAFLFGLAYGLWGKETIFFDFLMCW